MSGLKHDNGVLPENAGGDAEVDYSLSESEDSPILPPIRKKRRTIPYVDFSKVAQIFPEASTKVLCKLSEMPVLAPSKVLEIVPDATKEQIGEFLKVAEATKVIAEKN